MSQEKYLTASRELRSSVLLLAATVTTVLQALPQALGTENYRNLRKAVAGLERANAELTEVEDELLEKLAEIETDVAGHNSNVAEQSPIDSSQDEGPVISDPVAVVKPVRGVTKPADSAPGVDDAGDEQSADQASLKI